MVHVGSSVESCRGWNEERSERGRTVGGQDLHPQTDGDEVGEDGKDGEVVVDDTGGCYEEEVLNQLIQRYEEPNGMNRWDAPLFTILEEDADVPGEKIWQVLFGNSSEGGGGKGKGGVVVKPHAATVLVGGFPDLFIVSFYSTMVVVVVVIDKYIHSYSTPPHNPTTSTTSIKPHNQSSPLYLNGRRLMRGKPAAKSPLHMGV